MVVYFDVTEVREIKQHDAKGELIEVTYLDGSTKVFKGQDALYIMAAVKDFFEPIQLN